MSQKGQKGIEVPTSYRIQIEVFEYEGVATVRFDENVEMGEGCGGIVNALRSLICECTDDWSYVLTDIYHEPETITFERK